MTPPYVPTESLESENEVGSIQLIASHATHFSSRILLLLRANIHDFPSQLVKLPRETRRPKALPLHKIQFREEQPSKAADR